MVNEDANFPDREAKLADERRQQELDDLNNERAGRVTGRQERFLNQEMRDERDSNKKAQRQQEFISRLQRLLASDPAYKALYDDTFNKLSEAERKAELAMEAAVLALENANSALQDVLGRAARLSGGTRVFRDANGQVWTEDGQLVEGDTLNEIVWHGNEPSREDLISSRKNVKQIETYIRDMQIYQTNVLGHIRNRMTDEDNLVKKDEFKQFQNDMKQMPTFTETKPNQDQISDPVHTSASIKIFNP